MVLLGDGEGERSAPLLLAVATGGRIGGGDTVRSLMGRRFAPYYMMSKSFGRPDLYTRR
jgi:hypothetical protein